MRAVVSTCPLSHLAALLTMLCFATTPSSLAHSESDMQLAHAGSLNENLMTQKSYLKQRPFGFGRICIHNGSTFCCNVEQGMSKQCKYNACWPCNAAVHHLSEASFEQSVYAVLHVSTHPCWVKVAIASSCACKLSVHTQPNWSLSSCMLVWFETSPPVLGCFSPLYKVC